MSRKPGPKLLLKATPFSPTVDPSLQYRWAGQVPRRDPVLSPDEQQLKTRFFDGMPGSNPNRTPWDSSMRDGGGGRNPMPMPNDRTGYVMDRPRTRPDQVIEGLGLSKGTELNWKSFLTDQLSKHEIQFRAAVIQKSRELPADMRQVVAERALSLYKTREILKKGDFESITDLAKALPLGGKYYRRTPNGKGGHTYHYDADKYAGRDDAHLSGSDVAARNLTRKWSEAGSVTEDGYKAACARYGEMAADGAIKACGYTLADGEYRAREADQAEGIMKALTDEDRARAKTWAVRIKQSIKGAGVMDLKNWIEKSEGAGGLVEGQTTSMQNNAANGGDLAGKGKPGGDGVAGSAGSPIGAPSAGKDDEELANTQETATASTLSKAIRDAHPDDILRLDGPDLVGMGGYQRASSEADARRLHAQAMQGRLQKAQKADANVDALDDAEDSGEDLEKGTYCDACDSKVCKCDQAPPKLMKAHAMAPGWPVSHRADDQVEKSIKEFEAKPRHAPSPFRRPAEELIRDEPGAVLNYRINRPR